MGNKGGYMQPGDKEKIREDRRRDKEEARRRDKEEAKEKIRMGMGHKMHKRNQKLRKP